MGKFIHIKSSKFPILPGEEEEIVNEGMYGKALAEYLQSELRRRGYDVPFICAEDWGWWVELRAAPLRNGICIHSAREFGETDQFVCTDGFTKPRKWSWSKFRFIETTAMSAKIHEELMDIFGADSKIAILGVSEEFPF